MEIIITHLTDLHMKDTSDLNVLLARTKSISGIICDHIIDSTNSIILFCMTGDFVFSGKAEQYKLVKKFLDEILRKIEIEFPKIITYIIFVPGNHDCDFDVDSKSRNTILNSLSLNTSDPQQIEQCTSIQTNFFDFANTYKRSRKIISCAKNELLSTDKIVIDKEQVNLIIHCINTSWCSKLKEQKGNMKLDFDTSEIEKEESDIVITLLHHDAEWLDWDSRECWNNYYKKFSDVVLVGHDHLSEFIMKTNYDESSNYHIKGNQLYSVEKPEQSGFNILKIDISNMQECFFEYEWENTKQYYIRNISIDKRPFIRNRFIQLDIQLNKNIKDFIEQVNIDLPNKFSKEIKLFDIFGDPILKVLQEGVDTMEFIKTQEELMNFIFNKKYVVIEGSKEIGKTSLLKQVFNEFYKLHKYPIFIDMAKLNTCDGEELNRIIENIYDNYYKNKDAQAIMQESRDLRICFIDDFNNALLSNEDLKRILNYLKHKFSIIIITMNIKFNAMLPFNFMDTVNHLHNNHFYFLEMQPVMRLQKKKIIEKWLLLEDSNKDKNSIEFDARLKEKTNQVNAIMKNKLFDKTPRELLLVLSYLEQNSVAQIDCNGYSYIYEALTLDKLTSISNKDKNIFSMYKTILEQIALALYEDKNGQSYLDYDNLITIIQNYRKNYSSPSIKIDAIIDRLVDHNFLKEISPQAYKFRFNYIYYYFISNYFSKSISLEEKNKVIRYAFENIHKYVNYNIVLFLTRDLNFEYDILPFLKMYSNTILQSYSDFQYEEMQRYIEKWGVPIEDKINEIFFVPENKKISILSDYNLINIDISEMESEAVITYKDKIESTNTEIVKMQYLINFVSSMLKTYSRQLKSKVIYETIELIFDNTFKIMGALIDFSVIFIEKIIPIIEKKGDIDYDTIIKLKQILGEVYYCFISFNVNMLAVSLENEVIKGGLDSYCKNHNCEFARMVRLQYLIIISGYHLPINEIKELFYGKNKLEPFSQSIIRQNIYYYLCSYQYDIKDKQTVCSILHFNIQDILIEEQRLQE